ncbi:pantoate--beta-alanine ligase [Jiangella ureilytica]|uniref:Pantothenate synthetase n=1 Tax=Jiangella ureilytica TaxID=2530374 RepID=A0A4R4RRA6_9ACTN|nr:pantoate--beta-alanine ligase [Jiangella ureilytica]
MPSASRYGDGVNHPIVARTRDDLAQALAQSENESAVVMTLGALHEGHRALVRAARELVGSGGTVLVTIFVNPLQFGPGEDFERYPRTLEADLAVCADEGVDVVFAPPAEELYPHGEPQVGIVPGPLGAQLEGAARPTHFAGVLTVVAKLLNLTVPSYAVFGEKDYQQLTLVRRMVADLEMPYEIVGVPTAREEDGLALSSRNRYLSADERTAALALSRALRAGAGAAAGGPDAVVAAAAAELGAEPGVVVDYLELRSDELAPQPRHGPARLLVAARAGTTRLIDNIAVDLP